MFGQILPKIYSFGPICQQLSLQIYSFCEIKLKILQLKSNQIYNLRLRPPLPPPCTPLWYTPLSTPQSSQPVFDFGDVSEIIFDHEGPLERTYKKFLKTAK